MARVLPTGKTASETGPPNRTDGTGADRPTSVSDAAMDALDALKAELGVPLDHERPDGRMGGVTSGSAGRNASKRRPPP